MCTCCRVPGCLFLSACDVVLLGLERGYGHASFYLPWDRMAWWFAEVWWAFTVCSNGVGLRVTMLGLVTGTEIMGGDNGSDNGEGDGENNSDRMVYRMVDL